MQRTIAHVQSCGGDTTGGRALSHPARVWRSCLFAPMPVATMPSCTACCIRQEIRCTNSLADVTVGVDRTTFPYDSDAMPGWGSNPHLALRRRPLYSLSYQGSTHCYSFWGQKSLLVVCRSSTVRRAEPQRAGGALCLCPATSGPRIVARSWASISSGRSQPAGAGLGAEAQRGSEARGLAAP